MDLKIFISYHKNSCLLKNNILTPIHVGSALSKEDLGILRDDRSDNISHLNESFCELTAQYWVYKNDFDHDYIGFMHYRRHLNFNPIKSYKKNRWGLIERELLNKKYIEDFGLDEKTLLNAVEGFDIVTVEPWDTRNAGSKNNYDHYKNSDKKLHIKDYERAIKVLLEKHPEYKEDVDCYNNSEYGYYTNIFIMKKDIFMEYSSFLFDILFSLNLDITKYNKEEKRVYGYISEWLFGIYITHLKRTTSLKIKELERTFIKNPDIIQNNNNINLCFSSDNKYLKHLAAAISSILQNTKTKKTIDIYLLSDGSLKNKLKRRLAKVCAQRKNVNLYFLDVDKNVFKNFYLKPNSHFSLATYFRYMIPFLLDEVTKLLYLDCDIIVTGDIEELYNSNLEGNYLGAIKDILSLENKSRLKLKHYYNAGVLLMDLAKIRENIKEDQLIKTTLELSDIIKWQDQDVINIVFQDKIKPLDLAWNSQYFYQDEIMDYAKEELDIILKEPKLIHYVGHLKPWDMKSYHPLGREYFKYLKNTPWAHFGIFYKLRKLLPYKQVTRKYVIVSFLGIKFRKIRKSFRDI